MVNSTGKNDGGISAKHTTLCKMELPVVCVCLFTPESEANRSQCNTKMLQLSFKPLSIHEGRATLRLVYTGDFLLQPEPDDQESSYFSHRAIPYWINN